MMMMPEIVSINFVSKDLPKCFYVAWRSIRRGIKESGRARMKIRLIKFSFTIKLLNKIYCKSSFMHYVLYQYVKFNRLFLDFLKKL